jgi:hypothetical protein
LTKVEEDLFDEKMQKIFVGAAEKAFNAIVDHSSPSQLLYCILAVAALALVGHFKKFCLKWLKKGWSLACGCIRYRRRRSPRNPSPQADKEEMQPLPPQQNDLPVRVDVIPDPQTLAQIAEVNLYFYLKKKTLLIFFLQQPLVEREEAPTPIPTVFEFLNEAEQLMDGWKKRVLAPPLSPISP